MCIYIVNQNIAHTSENKENLKCLELQEFVKKMAKGQNITIIIMLLLQLAFPLIIAHAPATPAERHADVVVEGMVYCQSCDHHGMWSFAGAKPIGNATISVICKDHRNRVIFYKAFATNENGYFYAELKGFKVINPFLDHPLQTCRVKLVSSPLESCNILTNVNYGLSGCPLSYQGKRLTGPHYEAVIFTAGPLAFRPAGCPPKPHP